jgi:hypothetical protein
MSRKIAVVVTTHTPYKKLLKKVIDSISNQKTDIQYNKFLCVDNFDLDIAVKADWNVFTGKWGCPKIPRNIICKEYLQNTYDWVIFWDGDNIMPEDYINILFNQNIDDKIGIISTGIKRINNDGKVTFTMTPPNKNNIDFWSSRKESISDTSSAWRVDALAQVGFYESKGNSLDDYCLSLKITRLGWKVLSVNNYYIHCVNSTNNRSKINRCNKNYTLWTNRNFRIITPFAGRYEILDEWFDQFDHVDIPNNCKFTILDNSKNKKFNERLLKKIEKVSEKFIEIRLIKTPIISDNNFKSIHNTVASLYNTALQGCMDDIIITWEDDVFITDSDALYKLHENILPFTTVAGIGAVYQSRSNSNCCVASINKEHWSRAPKIEDLLLCSDGRIPIGMLGGGLTMWASHYIMKCLPFQTTDLLGWDGYLSKQINKIGGKLYLDNGVWATHKFNTSI